MSLNRLLLSGVSGPFAIPSVVSGAEKAVKDLEQLAAADPEALIDSIEELLPAGTSQEAGVAGGSSAGLVTGVTGLADPVLSKGNGSLTQGWGYKPAVTCRTKLLPCCAAQEDVVPKQYLYPFDCAQALPVQILRTLKQCVFPFCLPSSKYLSPVVCTTTG